MFNLILAFVVGVVVGAVVEYFVMRNNPQIQTGIDSKIKKL